MFVTLNFNFEAFTSEISFALQMPSSLDYRNVDKERTKQNLQLSSVIPFRLHPCVLPLELLQWSSASSWRYQT